MLKSVCIYCGSASGRSDVYANAMRRLAQKMVREGISLVYGGGNIGLMGVVADEVIRLGGCAEGVITESLAARGLAHKRLKKLHIVTTMHERKARMAELAGGFIAAPGGIGTMDELFEAMTWLQLGIHRKPVALLNTEGYYNGLISLLDHFEEKGFMRNGSGKLCFAEADPDRLIDRLKAEALEK